MSEQQQPPAKGKKSLWQILNTPVQDLFKEETAAIASTAVQEPPVAEVAAVEPVTQVAPAVPVQTPEPLPVQPVVEKAEPVALVESVEELGPIQPVEPVQADQPVVPPATPPIVEMPSVSVPVSQGLPLVVEPPAAEVAAAPVVETVPAAEVVESAEPAVPAIRTGVGLEEEESDWFKSFKDKLWLGLGNKEKPVAELEVAEKKSWLKRFRERLAKSRAQFVEGLNRLVKGRTKVDEDMLEELEELFLQSDMGIGTTDNILDFLRQEAKHKRLLPAEVLPAVRNYLHQELESEAFTVEPGKLNIFLIVGVNGTGKTTTVGKIAAKLKIGGHKVMIAAGDTFRAAAIDQLGIWGQRVGVPVIQHHDGADAAAVVFDAIQSAKAKKVDVLLIDTAGRLHNKDHLMQELQKVYRIIERERGDARLESLLVLDATTGQNGLKQAEVFSKSVPLNGLILTKLDGTAKGGVIFSIKQNLHIPIKLVGVGETLEDLQEFDPKDYVDALFSEE